MHAITVNPQSLSLVARRHGAAGSAVARQTTAERLDTAALAPAFGILGAPFLAALAATLAARAEHLEALAAAHAGQACATTAAAAAYTGTDAAAADGVRA